MKTMVPFSEMRKTVWVEGIRLVGREKSRVVFRPVHLGLSNGRLHRATNIAQPHSSPLSPRQCSLCHAQTLQGGFLHASKGSDYACQKCRGSNLRLNLKQEPTRVRGIRTDEVFIVPSPIDFSKVCCRQAALQRSSTC